MTVNRHMTANTNANPPPKNHYSKTLYSSPYT